MWQQCQTVCRRQTGAEADQRRDCVHHCRPIDKPRPATGTAEEMSAAASRSLQSTSHQHTTSTGGVEAQQ